jgi:putative aldouronate transport system substrate-binding protein
MEVFMCKRFLLVLGCVAMISSGLMAGGQKAAGGQSSSGGNKPVELDLFVNFSWFMTDSWTGIIPEEITRKTGVKLNVTRAVDDNQLGMMIASGNLPDLIFTEAELSRLASPNFSYSYNELIQKYSPEWQPNSVNIANSRLLNQPGDSSFYFLLTAFSTAEQWHNAAGVGNMPTVGVRQDILDELGNPPINNLQDFERVLGMVKQRYPNLIPYVVGSPNTWANQAIRIWSGVPNNNFIEEDGKVVYYTNSKNYKKYLQYVNGLYRKGYIMADNYSLTDTDIKALFQNGQSFSISHTTTGEIYSFGEMAKATAPKAYASELAPLSPDSKYYNAGTGWAGVVISKKNKNPEASIKFMQYMWTLEGMRLSEWGREGIEWTMGSDGLPAFTKEWLDASKDSNIFYTKYNPNYFISMDMVVEVDGRIAALPADYRSIYKKIAPYIYVCPWIGAATPKADGTEKNIITKLDDMVLSSEVKCLLAENDTEFNRYFDELQNNAKAIGVTQIEAYMNREVPKYRSLYQ